MTLASDIAPTLPKHPSAGALFQLLGEVPKTVTLERTFFPGRRAVNFVYRVRLHPGTDVQVLAEHHPGCANQHAAEATASLTKSRHGQRRGLALAPIVADTFTDLVLRRPGLDERLPGLRLLHDPPFAREMLRRIRGKDPGETRVRLMAHRLGKRAVLRIDAPGARIFARLAAIKSGSGASRFQRHHALWQVLKQSDHLRIPQPLGEVPDLGLSFCGNLPGDPPDFTKADCCESIAQALTCLQNLTVPDLPVHRGADEARLLADWQKRTGDFHPALARRLQKPLHSVSDRLQASTAHPVACHRDLHEKQILVAKGRAGILDFDTLSLADPALDPGNLLAHLFLAGLQTGRDMQAAEAHLLNALPGLAPDRARLWRQAALLRLSMIYAFTDMAADPFERLLNEASADDRH